MKTFTSIVVLVVLGAGLWLWGEKNNMGEKTEEPAKVQSAEFCFLKLEDSADSEFQDKYTLRMKLENEKASGELRLLPAEKDALVGDFVGTVSPADDDGVSWMADLIWNTEGEGMAARQELKIRVSDGIASIALGEMQLREDGVYAYKDPNSLGYSLVIPATDCAELNEREAVEKYLWGNIATLSPIAPALGGNWYVVAATLDLEKNSGMVTYEDGHIQEKRGFTYVMGADGGVESLTIQ